MERGVRWCSHAAVLVRSPGQLDQGMDPNGSQHSLGSSVEKQDCRSRAVLGTEALASGSW